MVGAGRRYCPMKADVVNKVFLGIAECRIHLGYFFSHGRKMLIGSILRSQSCEADFQQFSRFEHFIWSKAV